MFDKVDYGELFDSHKHNLNKYRYICYCHRCSKSFFCNIRLCHICRSETRVISEFKRKPGLEKSLVMGFSSFVGRIKNARTKHSFDMKLFRKAKLYTPFMRFK